MSISSRLAQLVLGFVLLWSGLASAAAPSAIQYIVNHPTAGALTYLDDKFDDSIAGMGTGANFTNEGTVRIQVALDATSYDVAIEGQDVQTVTSQRSADFQSNAASFVEVLVTSKPDPTPTNGNNLTLGKPYAVTVTPTSGSEESSFNMWDTRQAPTYYRGGGIGDDATYKAAGLKRGLVPNKDWNSWFYEDGEEEPTEFAVGIRTAITEVRYTHHLRDGSPAGSGLTNPANVLNADSFYASLGAYRTEMVSAEGYSYLQFSGISLLDTYAATYKNNLLIGDDGYLSVEVTLEDVAGNTNTTTINYYWTKSCPVDSYRDRGWIYAYKENSQTFSLDSRNPNENGLLSPDKFVVPTVKAQSSYLIVQVKMPKTETLIENPYATWPSWGINLQDHPYDSSASEAFFNEELRSVTNKAQEYKSGANCGSILSEIEMDDAIAPPLAYAPMQVYEYTNSIRADAGVRRSIGRRKAGDTTPVVDNPNADSFTYFDRKYYKRGNASSQKSSVEFSIAEPHTTLIRIMVGGLAHTVPVKNVCDIPAGETKCLAIGYYAAPYSDSVLTWTYNTQSDNGPYYEYARFEADTEILYSHFDELSFNDAGGNVWTLDGEDNDYAFQNDPAKDKLNTLGARVLLRSQTDTTIYHWANEFKFVNPSTGMPGYTPVEYTRVSHADYQALLDSKTAEEAPDGGYSIIPVGVNISGVTAPRTGSGVFNYVRSNVGATNVYSAATQYMSVAYTHPETGAISHQVEGDVDSPLGENAVAAFAYPVDAITVELEVPVAGNYTIDTRFIKPNGSIVPGYSAVNYAVSGTDTFASSSPSGESLGKALVFDVSPAVVNMPSGTAMEMHLIDANSKSVGNFYLMFDMVAPKYDPTKFLIRNEYLINDPRFPDTGARFGWTPSIAQGVLSDENGYTLTKFGYGVHGYSTGDPFYDIDIDYIPGQYKGVTGNQKSFVFNEPSYLDSNNLPSSRYHLGSAPVNEYLLIYANKSYSLSYDIQDPSGNTLSVHFPVVRDLTCYAVNYANENKNPHNEVEAVAYRDPTSLGGGFTTPTMENGGFAEFKPIAETGEESGSAEIEVIYRVVKELSGSFNVNGVNFISALGNPVAPITHDDDYAYYLVKTTAPWENYRTTADHAFGDCDSFVPPDHSIGLADGVEPLLELDYLSQAHPSGVDRRVGQVTAMNDQPNLQSYMMTHNPQPKPEEGVYEGGVYIYQGDDNIADVTFGLNRPTPFPIEFRTFNQTQSFCSLQAGEQYCTSSIDVTTLNTSSSSSYRIAPFSVYGDNDVRADVRAKIYFRTGADVTPPDFAYHSSTGKKVTDDISAYGYQTEWKDRDGNLLLKSQALGITDGDRSEIIGKDGTATPQVPSDAEIAALPEQKMYYPTTTGWDAAGNFLEVVEDDSERVSAGDWRIALEYLKNDGSTARTHQDLDPIANGHRITLNDERHVSVRSMLDSFSLGRFYDEHERELYRFLVSFYVKKNNSLTHTYALHFDSEDLVGTADHYVYVPNKTSETGYSAVKDVLNAKISNFIEDNDIDIFASDASVLFGLQITPPTPAHNMPTTIVLDNVKFSLPNFNPTFSDGDNIIMIPNSPFVAYDDQHLPEFSINEVAFGQPVKTGIQDIIITTDAGSIPLVFAGTTVNPGTPATISYDYDANSGKLVLPITVLNDGENGTASLSVKSGDAEYFATVQTWGVAPVVNPAPIDVDGDGSAFVISISNSDPTGCVFSTTNPVPNSLNMVSAPECYVDWGELSDGLTGSTTGLPTISGQAYGQHDYSAEYSLYYKDQFGLEQLISTDTIQFTSSPAPTENAVFEDGDNIIMVPNVVFTPKDDAGMPEFNIDHRDGSDQQPTGIQTVTVTNDAGSIAIMVGGVTIEPGESAVVSIDYDATGGLTALPVSVAVDGSNGSADFTVTTMGDNVTTYVAQLQTWAVTPAFDPDPATIAGDGEEFTLTLSNEAVDGCTFATTNPVPASTDMIAAPTCTIVWENVSGNMTPNADGTATLTGTAYGEEPITATYKIYARDQFGQDVLIATETLNETTVSSGPIARTFADGDNNIAVPNHVFVPKDGNESPEFVVDHLQAGQPTTGIQNIKIESTPASVGLLIDGNLLVAGGSITIAYDFDANGGKIVLPISVGADNTNGTADIVVTTLDSGNTGYEATVTTWSVDPITDPDPIDVVGNGTEFDFTIGNNDSAGCAFTTTTPAPATLDMTTAPECLVVWGNMSNGLTGSTSGVPTVSGKAYGAQPLSVEYSIYIKDQFGNEKLLSTETLAFASTPPPVVEPEFADGDNVIKVPNVVFVPRDDNGAPEFSVNHVDGTGQPPTGTHTVMVANEAGSIAIIVGGVTIQPGESEEVTIDYATTGGVTSLPVSVATDGSNGSADFTVTTMDDNSTSYSARLETWAVSPVTDPDPLEVEGNGEEFTISLNNNSTPDACTFGTLDPVQPELDMIAAPVCTIVWDSLSPGLTPSTDGTATLTGTAYGEESHAVSYSVYVRDQFGQDVLISTSSFNFTTTPPVNPIAPIFSDGDNLIRLPNTIFVPKDENDIPEFVVEHRQAGALPTGTQQIQVESLPGSMPLSVKGYALNAGEIITIPHDFDATGGKLVLPISVSAAEVSGTASIVVTTIESGSARYSADLVTWGVGIKTNPDPLDLDGDGTEFSFTLENVDPSGCDFETTSPMSASLNMITDPVCTIVWDSLPDGIEGSDRGVPRLSGRSFGSETFSVDYSVFIQDQHGQTKFVVTQTIEFTTNGSLPDIQPGGLKDTYEAYVESVDINFNYSDKSICSQYLTSQNSAIANNLDSSRTYCYVQFLQIPPGLEDPASPLTAELRGNISETGTLPLELKIFVYDGEGVEYEIQHIDRTVEAINPAPPTITPEQLTVNDSGKAIIHHTGGTYGRVRIGGVGAEVTIEIDDGVTVETKTLAEGTVRPGRDYVELLRSERQPIWRASTMTMTAYYTVAPDNKTIETFDFVVVPDETLRVSQVTEDSELLDTEMFDTTFTMADDSGLIEFHNGSTGDWTSHLAVRSGYKQFEEVTSPTPLTITADQACGIATPGCLATNDVVDTITADLSEYDKLSLYTVIDGTSPDTTEEVRLISNPVYVAILKGGPIVASVITRRTYGVAPYRTLIAVDFDDYKNQAATGEISWEVREGEGDWEVVESARPTQLVHSFARGVHEVRAKLVNKNDGTETYTDILQITAYPAVKLNVDGARNSFTGHTEELTAELLPRNVGDIIDPSEFKVEWSFDNGKTYTDEGLSTTVTSPIDGRVLMKIRARSTLIPEEVVGAYVYKGWPVSFNPPKPGRGAVYGPNSMEFESTYTYRAVDIPPYRYMGMELQGEWLLPDGSTRTGELLEYSPTEADREAGKATITRRVWFVGYEAYIGEGARTVKVTQYIFPDFAIHHSERPSIAPTDVTLSPKAIGYTGVYRDGEFTWTTPPSWTQLSQSSTGNAKYRAELAGTFPITLTVTDDRGNSFTTTQDVTLAEAEPYTLGIRLSKSNIYDRAPIEIVMRPSVQGGHPYDRVMTYEYAVNGQMVESSNGVARTTLGVGDHDLSLRMVTKYGVEETHDEVYSVVPNQLPTCDLVDYDKRQYSRIELRALCHDADGRVVKYVWTINGETYGNNSYRLLAPADEAVDIYDISVDITDDAGETTTFTKNVVYPPYGSE